MHLLLVEDSSLQGTVLKRLLIEHGYEVEWVRDGQSALNSLKQKRPRLVLTDVEMPSMNGFDLCAAIKGDADTRQIPVVLLTALNHVDDVVRGLQSGADNYLTKPYDDKYLLEKLGTMLTSKPDEPRPAETLQIMVGGRHHEVPAELHQVVDLLISTYEGAVRQNRELARLNQDLVTAQQEVARRNQELEALNQQKNQFLGMAAHDLRNPLAVILAYARFLLTDVDPADERRVKFIAKIQSSADFMLRLIDDLLDISKIESGRLDLIVANVDLTALVRQNVELNSTLAELKGLTLSLEDTTGPVVLAVDSSKLEQVLNNLLSNAIKFSHAGTTVTVRTERHNGHFAIRVQDQGQGIPKDELQRLFHPFSTTRTHATGGEKSTGLGLAIAHRIVLGHGGEMMVQSELGKGTEFSVFLPLET